MPVSDPVISGMKIEKIDKKHDIKDFSCGRKEYDAFIKEEAFLHQKENICDTYVLTLDNKVVAYASVCPDGIKLNPEDMDKYRSMSTRKIHDHYPALRITMLGRDIRHKGKGLGRLMIFCAVILARERSGIASYSHIILDAEPDKVKYYEKLGFKIAVKYSDRRQISMYVKIDSIYNLIESEDGLKSSVKSLLGFD